MRIRTTWLCAAVLAFVAGPASWAQTKKPEAAAALTLDGLKVRAADLPKGLELVDGARCVSVQATLLYETPAQHGILPEPKATLCQSFAQDGKTAGCLFAFEYATDVEEQTRKFVTGLLWGGDGPSAEHPEQMVIRGPFLIVVSFPKGSKTGEWMGDRLRTRFHLPIQREHPELAELVKQAMAFYEKKDAAGGLSFLRMNASKIENFSFGQYLLGEFASRAKDWPAASEAYGRAIALHDSATDPLAGGEATLWAAIDGESIALLYQSKWADVVPVLQRSAELAKVQASEKEAARAYFNLACAQSRLEHFDEALTALTESIRLDESFRASALKDADLAEACKRPEFKKLLSPE